jgi:hypothetical protein
MRVLPNLVLRGTLLMSFLMVLACCSLTRGATLASSQGLNSATVSSKENLEDAGHSLSSKCQVSSRFPSSILQWCDLITQYAETNGLPPDLIAALVWQESGGDAQAYSRSGAVGLMQVMPRDGLAATFNCANGPCFASRPTIAELQDPKFNLQYGTHFLAGLLANTQDLREALKRYGPKDMGYGYADKVLGIYEQYREE